MKKIIFFTTCFLATFFITSCGEDDVTIEPTQNIIQIAQSNGFTSLAAAVTKAGLLDDLQSSEKFTVFAPTNAAFDNLLSTIGQSSIDDVPAAVLKEILLYHVVSGEVPSSEIVTGEVVTLLGSIINLATSGGITVNGVDVISPFDVKATNGYIHTIDEVLVPESIGQFVNTILEPAYFSESFTTLVAAAVKANLVETLLSASDLTIFAPTNTAFSNAGINPETLDATTLGSVLAYHVVGTKVLSTGIPREAVTVNGNKIYFSLVSSGNFINGKAEIVAVDIESGSGVVHVINDVLLPPSGNIVATTIELSSGGEFTTLIAALQRTATEGTAAQNLITVLSGNGPFTVFAPTNAAFQALLDSNSSWNNLGDIPLDALISVLTYHVVPARAFDKDIEGALSASGELPTANGANIKVDLSMLRINSNSNITGINFNATNGVIHVIDAVLIP